jgi:signal transduction histidine kinase
VITVIGNMLKALTELARELSKISHVDNPGALLAQLQSISVDKINVKTYELRELKNASQRFQQQLVLNVEQAAKYSHLEMHARRMEAIAKTTQMLAHDVRKPFSMILMVMQTLKDCANPREIPEISEKFLPEVQAAISAANDMIEDVMEIDRAQQPKKEPVDPLSVIKQSFKEISRIHPTAQVDIHYTLNHQHMIDADALKLQRVFSNIISNAVQAMNNTGVLWISTLENMQTQMTTFCIENNGNYLPKDELSKVFDAFYTKNKANGTGLGLAISQRIIMAHGGEIWCESSQAEMTVKFYFTVPVATKNPIRSSPIRLPSHLQDLTDGFFLTPEVESAPKNIAISDSRLLSSEKKIHQYSAKNGRKLKLCILDDELIYQSGLVQLIQKSQSLENSIDIRLAKTREEVMALFATDTPDLLICDIDLGIDGLDGFQIVRELRKNGYKQAVCIHSNRSLPEDYKASISAGAQAILPKPMSLEHLIKFIVDSIPGIR